MINTSLFKNAHAVMKTVEELSDYKFAYRNGNDTLFFSIGGFDVSAVYENYSIELYEVDLQGNLIKDGEYIEVDIPDTDADAVLTTLLKHGLVPVVMVPEASSYTTEPEEEEPEEDEQKCDCSLCSAQDSESLSALFDLIFVLNKDFKN
ncbi:hypothetical protein ZC03_086 [Pseudomonas phage ZC03]|uniref:Uncharacterized protein n=2 Tax=Zicotriavirus TaxID=2843161 RepID=A0A1L2C979_9CAUD|nr:hypothetical protein HWA93_gp43 [Pseudomonas phage ZC03]YP_009830645.1 hypothetical protein HWA94_gp43 [Pseudomonas phage ZC08]AMD43463.1 hypothetical protein ZC03_086 [Pseudomonas phage ZC03]AMD43482.1 hypothetical protein ZC08_083 [Pseudomonas phage ZC08]